MSLFWCGWVQFGMNEFGLVQLSSVWYGWVWFGVDEFGFEFSLVQFGMDEFGLVWMSLVWYGWVWFGVVEFSLVWCSWVQFGMDEFGLVWLSSVWFDEVDLLKCSRSASQLSFTNLLVKKSDFFPKKFVKYQSSSSWLKEKQLQLNLAQLLSSRSSQLNTPWAGSAQLSSKNPDRVSAQLNVWARCKIPAQRTLRHLTF